MCSEEVDEKHVWDALDMQDTPGGQVVFVPASEDALMMNDLATKNKVDKVHLQLLVVQNQVDFYMVDLLLVQITI